ncbi:hypothetical protein ASA1KI_39660 [Opitutales bacterium ASA1]|uniref:hypothetical protein n=1 Tax=Congregicoccus parvus TaxID=3081749 RepID=UPI002B2FF4BC|nr:hypothetical protein ASA1KI_39660 [Opitutales bacterium ASA1]
MKTQPFGRVRTMTATALVDGAGAPGPVESATVAAAPDPNTAARKAFDRGRQSRFSHDDDPETAEVVLRGERELAANRRFGSWEVPPELLEELRVHCARSRRLVALDTVTNQAWWDMCEKPLERACAEQGMAPEFAHALARNLRLLGAPARHRCSTDSRFLAMRLTDTAHRILLSKKAALLEQREAICQRVREATAGLGAEVEFGFGVPRFDRALRLLDGTLSKVARMLQAGLPLGLPPSELRDLHPDLDAVLGEFRCTDADLLQAACDVTGAGAKIIAFPYPSDGDEVPDAS